MKTKLLIAAAVAALSLGAGVAQADTKSDAVTETKVSFYFGFYGQPYYYQPYYYYGPKCFYNYYGEYVCKYY
jgi:hypothetical protein